MCGRRLGLLVAALAASAVILVMLAPDARTIQARTAAGGLFFSPVPINNRGLRKCVGGEQCNIWISKLGVKDVGISSRA
jgi:hypothetical protein